MKIRITKPHNLGHKTLYAIFFILYTKSFVTELVDIPHFYTISTIILFVPMLYHLYRYSKSRYLPVFFVYTTCFYFVFLFTTLIMNATTFPYAVARFLRCTSFVLMLEYIFTKYEYSEAIDILMFSFEILIYGNFISMIMFPNGIHHVVTNGIFEASVRTTSNWVRTGGVRVTWLLGHQTTMIKYLLPAVIISYLFSKTRSEKNICIKSIILWIICGLEIIIANSATNYVTIVIFFAIVLLLQMNINIRIGLIFPLYIAFYSVIGQLSDDMIIVRWLSKMLGRSVRLSSRIVIWQKTISNILKHPIFGYGAINEESEIIRKMLGLGNPHSQFLWVAFEAGIIGIIAFILYILLIGSKYHNSAKSMNSILVYAAVLSMLIAMFTDDYLFRNPFALVLLFLCYYTRYIDSRTRSINAT